MSGIGTIVGFLFDGALLLPAQWLNHPSPLTPRGNDGKPNLSAKTPRAPDGKPDLSGVWQTEFESSAVNERLFGSSLRDFVVPGDDPSTFSRTSSISWRISNPTKPRSDRHPRLRAIQDHPDSGHHRGAL